MTCIKFQLIILYIIHIWGVNFLVATPLHVNNNKPQTSPNYLEIKLPVKITSTDDLINWIKNAMQTMASRIDITLASNEASAQSGENNSPHKPDKSQYVNKGKEEKIKSIDAKSSYSTTSNIYDFESPWLKNDNKIYSSISQESYLPLLIGNGEKSHIQNPYVLLNDNRQAAFANGKLNKISREDGIDNSSNFVALSDFKQKTSATSNSSGKSSQVESLPFAIPFEAYITISKESSDSQHQSLTSKSPSKFQNSSNNKSSLHFNNRLSKNTLTNLTNIKFPETTTNKNNSRKRQNAALAKLLRTVTKTLTGRQKIQQDPTTSTATIKSRIKNRPELNQQPFINFEDVSSKTKKNRGLERQEFDEDEYSGNEGPVLTSGAVGGREDDDDDDDYEENEGSLGSITELLPLAIPILEDLSDPESEADLIGLLQAGIPLIQGLSDGEDGGTSANEIIATLVPVLTKIVGGTNGEGSDIGAIVGPLFGLLAPFIGPLLAPLVGPLIRTISNPPTEGSSLPALITAIAGPLSEPQQPSGMSPLSIVIAGTTAGILKELKPGASGGSDLGAFIAAILSGVLAGTSAGLSGGSSEFNEPSPGYPQYNAPQASSAPFNVGFNGRPTSARPSVNSPFTVKRPNNVATTVNIGSTIPPSAALVSVSPVNNKYYNQNNRPTTPSHSAHSQQTYGPVPAAATNENGGSSYLPYGSTAVPAASVNPLSLIGNSVQEIFGAGIQVVSSLVNAVFGIIGASSDSQPSPSYGPPAGSYSHTSG